MLIIMKSKKSKIKMIKIRKNKNIVNNKTMVKMINRKVVVKFQVIGMTGKILNISRSKDKL